MKLKRKLIGLCTTLLLAVCATIGTALPVLGDSSGAVSDWSKVDNAGAGISIVETTDGGAHFTDAATGNWDGQFYTTASYNYDVPVNEDIDMYLDIKSGQVGIVLSGNGWAFNQQGSNVINWNPVVSVILTHYGENIQLQRTDNWVTMQIARVEGYNKLSFKIDDNGTEILFNDQSVFEFTSTSNDYINGTAKITVNRFSADTTLDTVIRSIPVAKNSNITYNNQAGSGFSVGYYGVDSAAVTGMKYAFGDANEYTAIDANAISATTDRASLDLETSREIFATAGTYKVVLETTYGKIYYNVTVTSEKDATAMWVADPSSGANLTALQDGAITYKNALSSGADGSTIYDITYNGEFSVEDDVVIDFSAPVTGFASFALTEGVNGNNLMGISIRNANANEDQSKFTYTLDYASYITATKNADGYTRLTFKIGENSTEVFADGVSIGETSVGKTAFTNGKVGVKAGFFYWSWASSSEYSVRVGKATAVNGSARYVQTSNEDVILTFYAPFAPVSALKNGETTIADDKYTLVESKENAGSIRFTAEQIDALFATPGEYTLTLETAMGNIDFVVTVVAPAPLQLVQNTFDYDVYAGGDLTVAVYANLDSVTAVKNGENVLTANTDYVFDAALEILTVKESYLKTLNKGNNVLTVITEKNSDGVSLTVNVEDHTPPAISGNASASFDKKASAQADVVFHFDLKDNAFVGLIGNNILSENYSFSGTTLTIQKEYLATLVANASYEFTAQFTYGNVSVSVEVANTTAPTSGVVIKNYNPSLPSNVTFDIEIYESTFVSFSGNGITTEDYTFEDGKLTLKKEYLEQLIANTYSFEFATAVGTLTVSIVVEEKEPPVANVTTATYDVQVPQNAEFTVDMNNGELQSFTGNGITSDDYTFENDTLVVKSEYLSTLKVGEYTFVFEADNGTLNFMVTVFNEVKPSFNNDTTVSKKYIRIKDKTSDFDLNVYANLGKLISVSGDEITEEDYTFDADLNTFTLKANYLATLGYGDNGLYSLVFDNGTLTLEVRFDYALDSDYLFVSSGATVSEGENGFVNIFQTAVQSSFNWGYVADYVSELSVNEPITVLYKFPQNPDKTWMYTVNISGGAHDYFWDTTKTVFTQFGVDGNAFYQLRAGSYPSDEYNYLTPAGLVCNANDVNVLTFDIGVENTKIYLNGVLVNTSPRTRADFADGKAYLRFSSTTTYTDSTPSCEYSVLVNGGVKADVTTKQFSLNAPEKVEWNLSFDNGQFVGLYLQNAQGTLTEVSNYRFLYSEFAKSGVLTLEKEDILNDATLSQVGTYTFIVKSTGGQTGLSLTVSDKQDLEIEQEEFIFDQRTEEDIRINVWLNVDTFAGITGNGITENDYAYANGVLTIFYSYLETLEYGEKTFRITSERNPDGLEFIVQIVDYSDPELENATVDFDVQNPADVVAILDVKAGTFVSVTGNYITANDYTFEATTGKITINKNFFNDFEVGKYTFVVNVDVFGTPYEVELKINVTNSKKPAFSDGSALMTVVFDKNAPADISIVVTPNNGTFFALYGSYISAADYTYDEATGTIVLKATYMSTLSVGTKNTVNINFDNGKIDVVIEIIETEQKDDSKEGGCGSTISMLENGVVCAMIFVCAGAILLKRRKTENE